MIKKILLLVIFVQVSVILMAQTEADALRYAEIMPTGSARYTAMGGAFSALGGDLTTLATNPAGVGIYRKSDFGITLGWNNVAAYTNYLSTKNNTSEFNMDLSNIGFVVTNSETKSTHWKFVNWGFAYNRLADFNYNYSISGHDVKTTILDEIVSNYNNNNVYNRDETFWKAFAVNDFGNGYVHYYDDGNLNLRGADTEHEINSSGYLGEYDFTVGGNYSEQLYLGATMGIQVIRFKQSMRHIEKPINPLNKLWYLESYDYLKTTGNGFNLKVGAIYKINQMLRLGFAFHTPTVYNMRDDYYTDVFSNINDPDHPDGPLDGKDDIDVGTGDLYYNYDYVSPLRVIGSAAYVLGKLGLVTGEVEYVDYTGMYLSASDDNFTMRNNIIDTIYRGAFNYKLGAEFRFGMLSVRAGGGYYSSSFVSSQPNSDADTFVFSGGVGLNTQYMYLNLAYQQLINSQKYYMYQGADATNLEYNKEKFLLTIGFRF